MMILTPRVVKIDNLGSRGRRLSIFVDNPVGVMADGYDCVRVYSRAPSDAEPQEVSDSSTRIQLLPTGSASRAPSCMYSFVDASGQATALYSVQYGRQSDLEFVSPFSDEVDGARQFYVSLAEAKSVVPQGTPTSVVLETISAYQDYFEQTTGWWFEPRRVELLVDGTGTPQIELPYPIIGLEAVYANQDFSTPVPLADLKFVTDRQLPEWRASPQIFLHSDVQGSVYVADPWFRFNAGSLNNKIVGTFGMVDASGKTPALIRSALLRCVSIHLAQGKLTGGSSSISAGVVTRVQVKDHVRVTTPIYKPSNNAIPPTTSLVTRDSFVDGVLRQYRRPVIASTFRSTSITGVARVVIRG